MPRENQIYIKSTKGCSSAQVKDLVKKLRYMLDKVSGKKTQDEREKLKKIFLTACRYEYLFWEQAFRQEAWSDEK